MIRQIKTEKKMTILTRFKENIVSHNLLETGDRLIVGASGGPDSQFLIYLLNEIKADYKLKITLAHLNHLHRKEAIYDENLVIETAKKLGLGVRVKKASMDNFARENKISAEDAGRRLRYNFFNELAGKNAKIAVAHNKDDQAETIIMRMIRGTGLDGLAGMDYRKDNIIRPILNFEKNEILAYLDENNIPYAIDQTNLSNDYTRNFVRNEIIPKMEEINPKTVDNIYSLSKLVKNDLEIIDDSILNLSNDVIKSQISEEIVFDKEKFENISYSYQARILRLAIAKLNKSTKDFSRENIDDFINLINLSNGKKIIKDDLEFSKSYSTYKLKKLVDQGIKDELIYLNLSENKIFNGYYISAKLVDQNDIKSPNIGYFDYDKLSFPLIIRNRKNGDKFKPLGFGHTKKLKDFFIDEKIDKDLRDHIPIIISNDQIIWIANYRMAEDFKVDAKTKKIVKIEVTND